MKKITLGLVALFGIYSMNAQESCANALAVPFNVNSTQNVAVPSITGTPFTGEGKCFTIDPSHSNWYSYTPSSEVVVTIKADAPQSAQDYKPVVGIYSGDCANLVCQKAGIASQADPTAEVKFLAQANETYLISYDYFTSQISGGNVAFNFTVENTSELPTAPAAVVLTTPANGATNVEINEADENGDGDPDNSVDFSWEETENATAYDFYLGYSEDNLQLLGRTTNTSAYISAMEGEKTYFWKVVAVNQVVAGESGEVWSFTTKGLSTNEVVQEVFTHHVADNNLSLNANEVINNVAIYNLLGQQLSNVEVNTNTANVNIAKLQSGVYIARVTINGKTQSVKFVK